MSPLIVPFLLRRVGLRHWRLAPGQSLLLVLILAIGVAGFVSIRLANRAALAGFAHFTETLTGRSDWIIQAPAGDLPASILPELRAALADHPVHILPVVETSAAPPAPPAETNADSTGNLYGRTAYTVLGVDLIAVGNFARDAGTGFFTAESTVDFWTATGGQPYVWMPPADDGDTLPAELRLIFADRIVTLPVAGPLPRAPDGPPVPDNLLVIDLPALQTLLGRPDRFDRVEFIVEPGPGLDQRRADLRDALVELGRAPGGGERWLVDSPGTRRETTETMTRAFRLNLTVLSLIALLVGLYLIFQALDGAVVRRRTEIAILRSLGVEESSIRRAWLVESAALGLVGGGLGLLLGWAGAQGAVRAIGRTINTLYFNNTVSTASLSAGEIVVGLGLGVLAALAAGWGPARAAARTPPAQVLPRSIAPATGPRWLAAGGLGAACLLAGTLCAQLPALTLGLGSRFPLAGYGAALLWIFGAGLLCAFLLPPLAGLLRRARPDSAAVAVAGGHLARPSGRHRLAAAALLCSIGMTAGMIILVASFDRTVRGWIGRTLQADLYLSSAGAQNASARNRLAATTAEVIAATPGVDRAARLAAHGIRIDGITTFLTGSDLVRADLRPDFSWIDAPREADFARDDFALVSESFAERFGRATGDRLRLPTPAGEREVVIVGIYADYGNEQGSVLVERSRVERWFADDRVTNLALWLEPGMDPVALAGALRQSHPGLNILTSASLRGEVLRVFRQTFGITYALQVIGVLVALCGLALTLTSIMLDRRAELTTLRALGFDRRELARAGALEGLGVALAASLGGLALSLALGWLLIHVINKQSFGWTLTLALPWTQLAALAATLTLAGGAVGWLVGRWGADLPADREE